MSYKWYDGSPGPTDAGNRPGYWPGGWLNGEWKCSHCGTTIGRSLLGHKPFLSVGQHLKLGCEESNRRIFGEHMEM